MGDLSDLYQEVILDHNRQPRNFGPLANADRTARGHNPLCGDDVTVFLKMADDRIEDIHFQGAGCAISKASASLMTEAVRGLTGDQARGLFERFQAMITSSVDSELGDESLGKLTVFGGVREFPMRIKCAGLAWHTLRAALARVAEPVKTE
jgi:nitrogen fixation NifU-like protein